MKTKFQSEKIKILKKQTKKMTLQNIMAWRGSDEGGVMGGSDGGE